MHSHLACILDRPFDLLDHQRARIVAVVDLLGNQGKLCLHTFGIAVHGACDFNQHRINLLPRLIKHSTIEELLLGCKECLGVLEEGLISVDLADGHCGLVHEHALRVPRLDLVVEDELESIAVVREDLVAQSLEYALREGAAEVQKAAELDRAFITPVDGDSHLLRRQFWSHCTNTESCGLTRVDTSDVEWCVV